MRGWILLGTWACILCVSGCEAARAGDFKARFSHLSVQDDSNPAVCTSALAAAVAEPFGDVNIGETKELAWVFMIEAQPGFYFTIHSMSLSGSPDFTIVEDQCTDRTLLIPPSGQAANCYYRIAFTPSSEGVRSTTLTFLGTRPDGPGYNISQLSGNGVNPEPKVELRVDLNDQPVLDGSIIRTSVSSYVSCGKIPEAPVKKTLSLKCLDQETSEEVLGCRYRVKLSKGTLTGGHDHAVPSNEPRPIGRLTPLESEFEFQPIVEGGASLVFEASDVSGDVDLFIEAVGPENEALPSIKTTFRVRDPASESFVPISIAGLIMNVASHPMGVYGTPAFVSSLTKALDQFYESLPDDTDFVALESQGATLPWGGLFDVDQGWLFPHCGHRDGKTIDLSIRSLSLYEKDNLEASIRDNKLDFYVTVESPESPTADHWHVQMKK